MHFNPTDSFYLEEAYQRIHLYPPPYFGSYIPPWLWYDGDKHGGMDPLLYEGFITARMSLPAPVTITMWGDYTPADGGGTVYVQFRNDSSATISGNIVLLITEDSLFYVAPNGMMWHNHVPRDYLPDYIGQYVSIAPGDSVTVSQGYSLGAVWNPAKCNLLAWIQDTVMQADSTLEIRQGAMVKVTELGIEGDENIIPAAQVIAYPNPCMDDMQFFYELPIGTEYAIALYDVTGRSVRRLRGVAQGGQESLTWDGSDEHGRPVEAGVYFYKFTSKAVTTTGKLVVR